MESVFLLTAARNAVTILLNRFTIARDNDESASEKRVYATMAAQKEKSAVGAAGPKERGTKAGAAVTMQNIADLLGISKATVSLALSGSGRISEEMRRTIFRTASELGFEPNPHARRLSKGSFDNLIGVFSLEMDLGTHTLKLSHIQQLLVDRGLQVSLHASGVLPRSEDEGANDLLIQVCRLRPRALVCNTSNFHPEALQALQDYQRAGGIIVCYDHAVEIDCDQVIFDRGANADAAAGHLLAAGHRRIGLHPGSRRPRDPRITSPRTDAFRGALTRGGLTLPTDWIFYSEQSYEDAGMDIARQFLALSPQARPTALYIINDRTASAFVNVLAREGVSIPRDVSVISDDDLPTARACYVPLTAVSHPIREISEAVVDLLDQRLQGSNLPPQTRVVQGKLVERDSVSVFHPIPSGSSGP